MENFVVSIWILISLIYVTADAQGDHRLDPFLFSLDANSPRYLELPTIEIPSLNEPDALRKVIATCPADTPEKNFLKAISIKGTYCLFQRLYNPNEIVSCTEEVKPMLHAQYDEISHKPMTCGTSKKHILYEFGFYYCGTKDVLMQLTDRKRKKTPLKYFKPRFFPIYELCINPSQHKALWTRHNIMTPAIFREKNNQKKLPLEKEGDSAAISVADLPSMKSKHFAKLETRFTKKQTQKKPTMQRTFMVPMDHIALRTWRKAANHYINVAPFLFSKEKLMNGINDGIKKLAFQLHAQNQRLSIYTAVRELGRKGPEGIWGHLQSKPNIWYKLHYEEQSKLAAMIVVHSDSTGPPKFKACEKPSTDCDTMPNWYEKRKDDIETIPQNDPTAYCCVATISDVEKIFNMYLEIKGVLDIDKSIQEYNRGKGNSNKPQMAIPYMAPGTSNQPPMAVPYPAPGKANHPLPPSAPPLSSDPDHIPVAQPYYPTPDLTNAKLPPPPAGYPPITQPAQHSTKAKPNSLGEVMKSG